MISLRLANKNDAAELGNLYYLYCQDMYGDYLNQGVNNTLTVEDCINKFKETKCTDVIVGTFDNKIVGFCSFGKCKDKEAMPNTGEIYQLYVMDDYRLKGDGRRMLHEAIRILTREEYDSVVTKCLSNQHGVIRFYENVGFKDTFDEYPLHDDVNIKVFFKFI